MKKICEKVISFFIVLTLTLACIPTVIIAEGKTGKYAKPRYKVKELVEKRTENGKVFLNSDGTYTAETYAERINYKKGDSYEPIDNSLEKVTDSKSESIYKNKANSFDTYFNQNLGSEQPIKLQFDKYSVNIKPVQSESSTGSNKIPILGKLISEEKKETSSDESLITKKNTNYNTNTNINFSNKMEKPVSDLKGQINVMASKNDIKSNSDSDAKDSTNLKDNNIETSMKPIEGIKYENVYGDNVDLQYMSTSTGIKEYIILNSYKGINKFDFNLNLGGLKPELDSDGSILLIDKETDKLKGRVPKSFMYDSSKSTHQSENIKTSIKSIGNDIYTLTLTVDDNFLKDKNTLYPITIDPTVNVYDNTNGNDVFIETQYHTQKEYEWNRSILRVGYYSINDPNHDTGVMRSYIRFPNLPSIENGIVVSASLNLHVSRSDCSKMNVSAYMSAENWDVPNSNWDNSCNKQYYSDTATTTYIESTGDKKFDITKMASCWYSKHYPNYGIVLIDPLEGNTSNRFMEFDASSSSNQPSLSVTYSVPTTSISCSTKSNGTNSGTSYVSLSWNSIEGAAKYYVGVFNGKNYEFYDAGASTSWTSNGKGIWPTVSEIQALQGPFKSDTYYFHHDGHGVELPNDPVNMYIKSGGPYPTSHNYWFRVIPENAYGQYPDVSYCSYASPTLPDSTAPNNVQDSKLSFNTVPLNGGSYTATVSWSAAADLPQGICSGVDKYWVRLWDTTVGVPGILIANQYVSSPQTSCNFSNVKDGRTYRASIDTFDKAGNYTSNPSNTSDVFTPDRTGPSAPVSITINNGIMSNGAVASIAWTGLNDASGIKTVQYSIDGGIWADIGSNLSSGTANIDVHNLNDGNHTLALRGIDTIGNVGSSAISSFTRDITLPVVAISSPVNQQAVNGYVPIIGSVNDTNISSWTLEYGQGTDPTAYTAISSGTSNMGANGSCNLGTFFTLPLINGIYTIRLTATDKAGNVSKTIVQINKSMTQTIAPKLVIDSPTNNAIITDPTTTITFHRTDGGSTSDLNTSVFINSNEAIKSAGNQSLILDSTKYLEGVKNKMYIKATDSTGNDYYSVTSYVGDNTAYLGEELTNGSLNDSNKLENFINTSMSGSNIVLNSGSASGSFETKTVTLSDNNIAKAIAINVNSEMPSSSSLIFDVSTDGGKTWQSNVTTTQTVYLNNPGKDIKIRCNFSTSGNTTVQPKITQLRAGVIYPKDEVSRDNPTISNKYNTVISSDGTVSLKTYQKSYGGGGSTEAISPKQNESVNKLAAKASPFISKLPEQPKTVYYLNGSAVTDAINLETPKYIILHGDQQLIENNKFSNSSSSVNYYMSTGDGNTWNAIQLDRQVNIDINAKKLAFRIDLQTTDENQTPTVSNLNVEIHCLTKIIYIKYLADSTYSFTVKLINEPTNVSAQPNVNYTTLLRWTPSTTSGVEYYNIYRDTNPDFIPSSANRIASNIKDNYWNDFNITTQSVKYYYKITAVKSFNGNPRESVPSAVCFANSVSGDELNKRLGLENQWGFSGFRTGGGQGYINLSTGNLCYQATDFVYPGPKLAEVMKRSFNSQSTTKTPLGYGWDFSFNTNLLREYDTNGNEIGMILKDGDGSIHIFTKNSDGTYNVPKALDMKLTCDASTGQYKIKRRDNIEYYFDSKLRLQQFKEPNGNTLTVGYDGRGNIISVTNSVGKATTLAYDNEDKLKTVTDPSGRVFHYAYDDENSDKLTSMTLYTENNIPCTEQYIYDSSASAVNMTSIKDPNGNFTSFEYSNGNVSKVTDPMQEYYSFDYSQINAKTSITSRNGIASFTYDSDGCIKTKTDEAGHSINYEYDNNCNVNRMYYINKINGAEVTVDNRYSYDSNGNISTITDTKGNVTTYKNYNVFNEAGEVDKPVSSGKIAVTTYQYDSCGNIKTATDAEGRTVSYTYDSMGNRLSMTDNFGNVTQYQYDSLGRLIKTIEPLGKTTEVLSYDAQGNPTSIKDADGIITNYKYDILGRQTLITYADSKTSSKAYDMNGNVTSETDRAGFTTSYMYDFDDRQISVTTPDSKTTKTTYNYDANNNMVVTITDPEKRSSVKYYNTLGRLYKTVAGGTYNTYEYDYIGNMTKVLDKEGRETDAVYNEYNEQIKSIADPSGKNIQNSITYDLQGNKLTTTDGEGHTTTNTYDKLGRLLTVTSIVSGKTATTTYSYDNIEKDANGSFIDVYNTVTDALGRVSETHFDALGRKIKDVKKGLPGANDKPQVTTYSYDLNGNLLTLKEPDGKSVVTYTYNNLNQLKNEKYDENNFLDYGYDDNGNKNSVAYTCDGIKSQINLAYNSVGQLTQTVQDGMAVNYDYDGSGNLNKISYPSDGTTKALKYDYDSYNRLQNIMVQTGSDTAKKVRDYTYTPSSRVDTVTNYLKFDTSGTDTEKIKYTYNSVGNPDTICYNINGTDKEKYTLSYDKNGNIANESAYTNYDTSKTITKQYQYDEIGELLSATNNDSVANTTKTTSYTYDLVGNRLTMTQDKDVYSYVYDNFNHETFEYKNRTTDPNPITTITYDDNGNEKTDVSKKDVDGKQKTITTKYTFNSANNLVSETVDDGTTKSDIKNYYDATGNRVKEHVTTTNDDGSTNNAQPFEIKYFYLGQNLLFTADKDNNKGTENILTPSGQIAASKRFDGVYANNYYFYNYDARGSVTNILDPDGKVVKGYTYDEFGNTKETDATKKNGFKNDVKFTGAIEDQSAGLYYMNARFYNPTSGRFISQDSYSGNAYEPWTQHLYSYSTNNPVNMVDPTGHMPRNIVSDDNGHYACLKTTNINWYGYYHQAVVNEIMTNKPGIFKDRILTSFKITDAGRYGKDGIPDIVDAETYEMWEVKPRTNSREFFEGIKDPIKKSKWSNVNDAATGQLGKYVKKFNETGSDQATIGTMYIGTHSFYDSISNKKISFSSLGEQGMIYYWYNDTKNKEETCSVSATDQVKQTNQVFDLNDQPDSISVGGTGIAIGIGIYVFSSLLGGGRPQPEFKY